MEFPGQWVTYKNLWVGSPRSGMPEQCTRGLTDSQEGQVMRLYHRPHLKTVPTSTAAPATMNCDWPAHRCVSLQVKDVLTARGLSYFCFLITHKILCILWLPHKLWSRSDSRENRRPWRKEEEIWQSHGLVTPGWWKGFSIKISRSSPSLL